MLRHSCLNCDFAQITKTENKIFRDDKREVVYLGTFSDVIWCLERYTKIYDTMQYCKMFQDKYQMVFKYNPLIKENEIGCK